MKENTRNNIKTYFEDGDRPTGRHFEELIDSFINKLDDEIYIIVPKGKKEKRVGIGSDKPKSKLDVQGGIKIGNATDKFEGVIRWTGFDFEGFDGKEWRSLTRDDKATREIFIPQPQIECTADRLYAYWDGCTDKRFLDYSPVYWLYRYKSRIKQTYKDKSKPNRLKPKKWAHTAHMDTSSHNNARHTEFSVDKTSGKKQLIDIEPLKWFKPIPNDTSQGYWIPKGQGMNPIPEKAYFNRRFEYFRLRIMLNVNGTPVFGPFSETFSLGYRRRYFRDSKQKKYKPVFELVQTSKGMNHTVKRQMTNDK